MLGYVATKRTTQHNNYFSDACFSALRWKKVGAVSGGSACLCFTSNYSNLSGDATLQQILKSVLMDPSLSFVPIRPPLSIRLSFRKNQRNFAGGRLIFLVEASPSEVTSGTAHGPDAAH